MSEKCPKKVLFMSVFCPTFEMSTKRNTSKTNKMKTITRELESIKRAQMYHGYLLLKYKNVQLIDVPVFTEKGFYTWTVSN